MLVGIGHNRSSNRTPNYVKKTKYIVKIGFIFCVSFSGFLRGEENLAYLQFCSACKLQCQFTILTQVLSRVTC